MPTTSGVGTSPSLFSDFGLTIGSGLASDPPNGLSLYNSNCAPDFVIACTGNDGDLASGPSFGTDPQGRILIAQNSDPDDVPDDLPGTYTFRFIFDRAMEDVSVEVMDLDESLANISFTLLYNNGSDETFTVDGSGMTSMFSATLLSTATGDNSLRRFEFGNMLPLVDQLNVNFNQISGAVSAVTFAPVPLPAALPLAVAGLGALGALRLRRRST